MAFPFQIHYLDLKTHGRKIYLPKWSIWIWAAHIGRILELKVLNNETLNLIKKMDFTLSFGLESGSEIQLKRMNKTSSPKTYLSRMKESAKLLNENQIFWSAHIIFGFPGEK